MKNGSFLTLSHVATFFHLNFGRRGRALTTDGQPSPRQYLGGPPLGEVRKEEPKLTDVELLVLH